MVDPQWSPDRCVGINPGFPVFAPPVLMKDDFVLSQTPCCMEYVHKAYGPASSLTITQEANASQATHDALDIAGEIFDIAMQKKDKEAFATVRLKNWLKHFEKIFNKTPEKTFLMSDEPLTADFALLCAFYSVEYALGNEKVEAVCPEVFKPWRAAIEARPGVVGYKAQNPPEFLFESCKAT